MRQHKLWYQSSYDRGLDILLFLWPDIKKKYSDAELHITYGWDLFDVVARSNPERREWQENVKKMMQQPGIFHHGRLGKDKITKLRKECGIWAYPTNFTEINCISALETQHDGLVPVTMAYAALPETVGSGVMVAGSIFDVEVREKYLKELLDMMGDEKRWKEESKKAIKFSENYNWERVARSWNEEFKMNDQSAKMTVYTPTVRKGWWNIMAENLSKQTYKNFEWLIVDDSKEDRSQMAKEYARKYKLDIRYIHGKKRTKKRTYGLVNANNTALQEAKGEVLIFLQDFILIPQDGVEQFVFLHKKHPNALIASCDMYVAPKIKPDITKEDWFSGNTDVIGSFIRQNIRIRNEGIRFSNLPFDFEQNYGGIPVKIAKELGGWYEFMDEGLGFDNTDIALRALTKGYTILVDETNVAVCIDHWEALSGTRENVLGRARRLNDPRYSWEKEMIKTKKLPIIRTQEVDDKIDLIYKIPDEVDDKDVVKWLRKNGPEVTYNWLHPEEAKKK